MLAASRRMKMLSKFPVLAGGLFWAAAANASIGEKRTILTSGDKVHTVHYQLGQSTVLYFGMKPETVICGNKNYFHIDKLKEGLTIQAISNISTNLTVLSQGRRYLFYLTPTTGRNPDTFIDVRWVPDQDTTPTAVRSSKQIVKELTQEFSIGELNFKLIREIIIDDGKRTIVEFELNNTAKATVKTGDVAVLATKSKKALPRQISVFEQDEIKPHSKITARLIVTGESLKNSSLIVKYQGKTSKVQGGLY